ncbi:MAG: hypothetical protein AB1486_06270 [Planctomycetota bacterium]
MLSMTEMQAIRSWYEQEKLLTQARLFVEKREWELLEEHLQMIWLFPLSRHSELPDFMLDEAGQPVFPANLNPRNDLEKWRDAVEVGWQVIHERLGLSRDDVHARIAAEQEEDWAAFMKSVEERKKERGAE